MDNPEELPRVLALCVGYAGLERGIEAILGKCTGLAYVEIEAFAITNLVNKMETGKLDPVPIWTDLKSFNAAIFRGQVDILTAGFPCQPFSNAGTKNGTEDPRHLWPYIEKTILLCRPATIFLENVEGIISTKTIHHHPKLCDYCERAERRLGKTWGSFIRSKFTKYFGISVLQYVEWRLERMGYKCESGIFSAEEVGAPHRRKRVFIMAESTSKGLQKPRLTGIGELRKEESQGVDNRLEQQGSGKELAHSGCCGSEQPRAQQSKISNIDDEKRGNVADSKYRSGETGRESTGREKRSNSDRRSEQSELANPGSQGRKKCRHPGEVQGKEIETCTTFTGAGHQWPARPGQPQHEWEEPRVLVDSRSAERQGLQQPERWFKNSKTWKSSWFWSPEFKLGRTIDGTRNRVDRLRLLGNGVVWQTAAKAFFVLSKKLNSTK